MSDFIHRRTEPEPEHPDGDLHDRLRALSGSVAFPETPNLAASVRQALAQEPISPRPRVERAFPWMHRPAALAAAVALLLMTAIVLIPSTRETVAGWLGVPGIEIQFRDDDEPTPAITATPIQELGLLLGEPVTLEDARLRVGFDIAIPEASGLGMPDEIYVRLRPGADQVVFLYGARPGFPAAAETGIGLLFIQFEALDGAFWGVKQISGSNDVRVVNVNRDDALWIGGSHLLMIAPNPDPFSIQQPTAIARPSANVLLWDDDGITYRIESTLSQRASVALAESVTLLEPGTPTP